MKTIETRDVDKSTWRDGPWKDEPDTKQWLDEATGLPCLIVRQTRFGHLCGYVGVSAGHIAFEKDYDDVNLPEGVHGGLTYADHCAERVCHVVEPGEDDNVWWLGFDCAHSGDVSPYDRHFDSSDSQYRDFGYVEGECRSLARQLAEMK